MSNSIDPAHRRHQKEPPALIPQSIVGTVPQDTVEMMTIRVVPNAGASALEQFLSSNDVFFLVCNQLHPVDLERLRMVSKHFQNLIRYPVSYTHLTLPTKRIV